MAAKDVKFGNDARTKMLKGVNVLADRSEERRVGKECRSRGWPDD